MPENKKIRIEKTKIPKCRTQKSGLCVFANKGKLQNKSRPRLTGSKRTTFRGAEQRCKSV